MANEGKDNSIKGDNRRKKKNFLTRKIFVNLLTMGIICALTIVLAATGLKWYTRHGEEIDVPDLKGLTIARAVEKLEEKGLIATLDDSVYVKNQVPNTIYNQSIAPGSHVKVGRIIHLTINASQPPMISIPDIADNCSVREATMKLTVLGLKLGTQEYINGEKDWVYAIKVNGKNVSAGDRIPYGSTVTLVVGDGTYFDSDFEDNIPVSNSDDIWEEEDDTGSDINPL